MKSNNKLRVVSLFSGIGAFEKSLENIGVDYELVGFSEIDKYAIEAYCAIHNVDKKYNLGDISKVEDLWQFKDSVDLIVGGSPCQDFSIAGKQQGSTFECLDCGKEFNPLVIHHTKRDECPNCNSINLEKTRSSLLIEYLRTIREIKPKYFIYENVKNIVGKKFKSAFDLFERELQEYGYNIYWQVLNAKDYGIPQNRERVFVIGIRKDIDKGDFEFPLGFDSGLRLRDFLDSKVDEKYYIDNEKVEELISRIKDGLQGHHPDIKGEPVICEQRTDEGLRFFKDNICGALRTIDSCGDKRVIASTNEPKRLGGLFDTESKKRQAGAVWDKDYIAPTIDTCQGGYREPSIIEQPKVAVREATKKGYAVATVGDSINFEQPNSKTRRGRVGKGVATMCAVRGRYDKDGKIEQQLEIQKDEISNSLTTVQKDNMVLEPNYRIRKLTPLECWRLMGFTDKDYWKARYALESEFYNGRDRSNSQMYKMAGNSIVVDVLEHIFRNLFKDYITY